MKRKQQKRKARRALAAVAAVRAILIDDGQWIELRNAGDAIEAITQIFEALGFGVPRAGGEK